MNIKLLTKLYTTHSPSKREDAMVEVVANELDTLKIKYQTDVYNQIYRIIDGKPLLCAHLDQVQTLKCDKVMSIKNRIMGFTSSGLLSGLGADDKNGIFIILNLLAKFRDISFIFSTNEECGGYLHHLTEKINLSSTPYALVFDRKGFEDIIGTANQYCCDDLEQSISILSGKLKYKPADGIFSDCDELSKHVPCVNLSAGYYTAHSKDEFTKPSEIFRAIQLGETLLENLPRKNRPFELAEQFEVADTSYAYGYGEYWNHDTWDDTDWKRRYNNYKPAAPKTSFDPQPLKVDECELYIDSSGVYFFDEYGYEIYLAETVADAIAEWSLDIEHRDEKAKLLVDRKLINGQLELYAELNGQKLNVNDFRKQSSTKEVIAYD